ncbi:hypothetical protein D3C83_150040 [compost metagenome]
MVVVTDAGSTARLKATLTGEVAGTPVAPSAGVTEATARGAPGPDVSVGPVVPDSEQAMMTIIASALTVD